MISGRNKRIINAIQKLKPTYETMRDLFGMAMNVVKEDESEIKYALELTKKVKETVASLQPSNELNELYWNVLLWEAPYLFESFLLYMEKNRPNEEKFYEPRVNPLKRVVDAIQELADDELDELFINQPPRTGKTQIVKLAFIWWGSRNTELSNLYTAFSDKITKAFYTGCYELMTDPTYTYAEIFPENVIKKMNGDDETIDLNRVKTYPTFTCRSIYGTLNGSCDCNGLAIDDDLFSGISEAISTDRQQTVWGLFDNNFMKRLKKKAKLINMGTRWALGDCQGRRRSLLEDNPEFSNRRFKIISIPALNEHDESNFDYPYDVGYSTEDYRMMRASFEANDDMASWFAQCQQEPIERQGALFSPDSMRFYNGILPDGAPDRIYMAVDEAFGGGDYVAAPICYEYGDECYIVDAVFNNGDKYVTRPLIRDKILEHKIQAIQFEETKTTTDYHEWIDNQLQSVGYKTNITWKAPGSKKSKDTRIRDKAPEIREMYFLEDGCRHKEYQKFMQNIFSFKYEGKNKHDDAPDAMAQLCDMRYGGSYAKCEAFKRPF